MIDSWKIFKFVLFRLWLIACHLRSLVIFAALIEYERRLTEIVALKNTHKNIWATFQVIYSDYRFFVLLVVVVALRTRKSRLIYQLASLVLRSIADVEKKWSSSFSFVSEFSLVKLTKMMSSSHARVERRLRGMQLAQILYKCQDKTKDAGEEDSKFTNIYLPCYANAKKAHRETFVLFEFFRDQKPVGG